MEDKLKKLKQDMETDFFTEIEFSEKEKERVRSALSRRENKKFSRWFPPFLTFSFSICVVFFLGQYVLEHFENKNLKNNQATQTISPNQVERITAKGGFYDPVEVIEGKIKTTVNGVYQDGFINENVKIICRFIDYKNRCGNPFYYFIEDHSTVEEAFLELQNHLPMDSVVINSVNIPKVGFVYNLYSDEFEKNLRRRNGNYHVVFKINEEGKVFAATTGLNTYGVIE